MKEYSKSNILCIGGLEFHFPEPISWPTEGILDCYLPFLERVGDPVCETDVINVTMKEGIPPLEGERSGLMDSGDGILWFKAGDFHVVEKVLPNISPEPLWRIKISLEGRSAELFFSDLYIKSEVLDEGSPVATLRYPIDQHMAIHMLSSRQGALIHSAGIGYKGKGFMCSGVSGAGKTTTSRLLIDAGGFDILTDDRVILRYGAGDGVTMHGTPWTGEGQYATSGIAPLAAMFFLKQDTEVRAERLSTADAVARMLPVTSVPWFSEELMTGTLKTLEEVAKRVPAYDLHFTKTADTPAFIAERLEELKPED